MAYTIESEEQYWILRFQGEVASEDLLRMLQQIENRLTENAASIIADFSAVAEIHSNTVHFLEKAAHLVAAAEGIFIVTGLTESYQEQLSRIMQIENLTFLPTIQEGIDAVFFNDLERQFRAEGGDMGLL